VIEPNTQRNDPSTNRTGRGAVWPVVLIAIFGAVVEAQLFPAESVFIAVALFFGLCAAVAIQRYRSGGFERSTAIVLLGGLAISVAVVLLSMSGVRSLAHVQIAQIVPRLTRVLLGWGLCVLAVSGTEDTAPGESSRPFWRRKLPPTPVLGLLVFGGSLVILGSVHWIVRGRAPAIVDETLYLLQARLFGEPQFSRPLSAPLYPFFMLRQAVFHDGRLLTQYPPGWPVLLAVFDWIGAVDWAGAICGSVAVLLTFLLGRRLYSARVGLAAAALMVVYPRVLEDENNYWSHGGSTVFLLIAAYLAFGYQRGKGVASLRWLVVGASIGIACAIRPLTGAAGGTSLALWFLIRARPSPPELGRIGMAFLFGALIPAAGTAYYNSVTLGNALTFGYDAASGSLQHLGFGVRGMIAYDHAGTSRVIASNFSVAVAISQLIGRVSRQLLDLLPSALLIPLVVTAEQYRYAWRLGIVAAFLVLPVAYAFWYYDQLRFYVDILPFAFIGIACIAQHLSRRRPRVVGDAIIYLAIVAPVAGAAYIRRYRAALRPCRESHDVVRQLARAERLLVFVKDVPQPSGTETLLECLYSYDTGSFSGDVVVARDLGAADTVLMRMLPQNRPVRLSWDRVTSRAVIERLSPGVTAR
jgi:Dolichyl-phosphate-mannose-protein mannosyltransferase